MRRLFYIIDTIKFLFLGPLVFIYIYSARVSFHQEQNRFSCPTSALGITLIPRKAVGAPAVASPGRGCRRGGGAPRLLRWGTGLERSGLGENGAAAILIVVISICYYLFLRRFLFTA